MIYVLHVDDERLLLDLSKEFLEQQVGFQVDTAVSVEEALQKLSEKEYDAVVSDYKMPRMDGLEFLSRIRDQGSEIPFIMFTGKGREEVAVEAFTRGADGYVMKGGDPTAQYAELANWIKAAVARRDSLRALKESEERYRYVVENLHDPLTILGEDRRIEFISRQVERYGYAPEELIGERFDRLLTPESLKTVAERYEKRRRGETVPSVYEAQFVRKDGKIIYMEISATLIKTEDGRIKTIAALKDITERRQSEEELEEIKERYRGLLEETPVCLIAFDLKGTLTFINKMAEEVSGYSRDELVGKNGIKLASELGLFSKETLRLLLERMKSLLSGEPTIPREVRFKCKDGRWIWLEMQGKVLKQDRTPVGIQIIARDVTRRRNSEEALRKSEERYRGLIELSPAGVITFDMKGVVTSANDAVFMVSGFTRDEIVGKHFTKLRTIHVEDLPRYVEIFNSVLRGKLPKPFEFKFQRKDGTSGWARATLGFIEMDGEKIGFQLVLADISERRRIEDWERFLHSLLRHDLTNKLQGGYGLVELLKRTGLSGKQEQYVESLRDIYQDANNLIEKIRELRTIEEAKESVNIALDLAIRNAIEDLSIDAEHNGIAVNYKGSPRQVVNASPLLQNLFTNLIANSIKHAECKKITITTKELKDRYRVSVKDDGKGIPESVRGKLFERGVKGAGSTGSGLGLHLVKRIIEVSNGTIELKDTKKGTRFDIHLKKAET